MIHVIVSFKNSCIDKTAVHNDKVASDLVNAIISKFRMDNIIQDIERIETVDYITKEHKTVYEGIQA